MKGSVLALVVAVVLCLLFLWPFAIIWSFNTLFDLTIPFTLKTYGAAFVLMMLVSARANYNKKD